MTQWGGGALEGGFREGEWGGGSRRGWEGGRPGGSVGGGGGSKWGNSGWWWGKGPRRAIWGVWGGGGGGAQVPLTSPCPPSNHIITINLTLTFAAS